MPKLDYLLYALERAREHLAQYERYSEEMRTIGRGCHISSECQGSLLPVLDQAIEMRKYANHIRHAAGTGEFADEARYE